MHEVLCVWLHSDEERDNSHGRAVVDSVVEVFWFVDCREQRKRLGNKLKVGQSYDSHATIT